MGALSGILDRVRTGAVSWGQRYKPYMVPRLKIRPVEDPFPFKFDEEAQRNHDRNHVIPFNVPLTMQPPGTLFPGVRVFADYVGAYQSVMTQQITNFEFSLNVKPANANFFSIILVRTPLTMSIAQLFATTGDQTILYHRTFQGSVGSDRKTFPFGFGAPSGWYCNVGEILRLMVAMVLPAGATFANAFGDMTFDYLETFRQKVNR